MDARRTIKSGYNQLGNMHLLEQPEDMMEIAIYFLFLKNWVYVLRNNGEGFVIHKYSHSGRTKNK